MYLCKHVHVREGHRTDVVYRTCYRRLPCGVSYVGLCVVMWVGVYVLYSYCMCGTLFTVEVWQATTIVIMCFVVVGCLCRVSLTRSGSCQLPCVFFCCSRPSWCCCSFSWCSFFVWFASPPRRGHFGFFFICEAGGSQDMCLTRVAGPTTLCGPLAAVHLLMKLSH